MDGRICGSLGYWDVVCEYNYVLASCGRGFARLIAKSSASSVVTFPVGDLTEVIW